jgi:hypothetical protein
MELHWFIPDVKGGGGLVGQGIAACLSFIPPAEDGNGKPVLKLRDHPFHHRRFAGTAYREIADADERQVEGSGGQYPNVKEPVSEFDDQCVDQGERK